MQHTCGYDSTWGWLRDPGNSLAQLYLATNPKAYRLYVGSRALLIKCREHIGLSPPGVASEAEAVRACVNCAYSYTTPSLRYRGIGRAG